MEKIDVTTLHDNVFTTIGKEWMLVAAGNVEKFNMMTASWGCLGWLWNRPVAIVYIRPERYTHEFIEANDTMSLVFLGNSEEARKAYTFCGTKSGRDFDKAKEAHLTPVVPRTVALHSKKHASHSLAASCTRHRFVRKRCSTSRLSSSTENRAVCTTCM